MPFRSRGQGGVLRLSEFVVVCCLLVCLNLQGPEVVALWLFGACAWRGGLFCWHAGAPVLALKRSFACVIGLFCLRSRALLLGLEGSFDVCRARETQKKQWSIFCSFRQWSIFCSFRSILNSFSSIFCSFATRCATASGANAPNALELGYAPNGLELGFSL